MQNDDDHDATDKTRYKHTTFPRWNSYTYCPTGQDPEPAADVMSVGCYDRDRRPASEGPQPHTNTPAQTTSIWFKFGNYTKEWDPNVDVKYLGYWIEPMLTGRHQLATLCIRGEKGIAQVRNLCTVAAGGQSPSLLLNMFRAWYDTKLYYGVEFYMMAGADYVDKLCSVRH